MQNSKRLGQWEKGHIPWNKNKKLSEETKEKLSIASKNQKRWYKYTDEVKEKMQKAIYKHHIDRNHSNECNTNLLYILIVLSMILYIEKHIIT